MPSVTHFPLLDLLSSGQIRFFQLFQLMSYARYEPQHSRLQVNHPNSLAINAVLNLVITFFTDVWLVLCIKVFYVHVHEKKCMQHNIFYHHYRLQAARDSTTRRGNAPFLPCICKCSLSNYQHTCTKVLL